MAKSSLQLPKLPDFYEDANFTDSQNRLKTLGYGLMEGDVPDFYKAIGADGGKAFEDVVRLSNRDIERSGMEAAAKTGARGAGVASVISRAVADNTTRLRWDDLLRTTEDKKWLFGTGINTVGSVRDSALSFMGEKNRFNLGKSELENQQAQLLAAEKARKSSQWSQILSSALGAAGTIGGFMVGGPAGAAVGGSLGSAAGGAATGGGAAKVSGSMGKAGGYWTNLDYNTLMN